MQKIVTSLLFFVLQTTLFAITPVVDTKFEGSVAVKKFTIPKEEKK